MRLRSSLALIVGALLASAGGAGAQGNPYTPYGPIPKFSAFAVATPARYAGHCPVKITFEGEVRIPIPPVSDPAGPYYKVAYTWLRSDGAKGPVNYGPVSKRYSLKITESWTLGSAALPDYKGAEQLKVWLPEQGENSAIVSDRAGFHIKCQ